MPEWTIHGGRKKNQEVCNLAQCLIDRLSDEFGGASCGRYELKTHVTTSLSDSRVGRGEAGDSTGAQWCLAITTTLTLAPLGSKRCTVQVGRRHVLSFCHVLLDNNEAVTWGSGEFTVWKESIMKLPWGRVADGANAGWWDEAEWWATAVLRRIKTHSVFRPVCFTLFFFFDNWNLCRFSGVTASTERMLVAWNVDVDANTLKQLNGLSRRNYSSFLFRICSSGNCAHGGGSGRYCIFIEAK